MTIALLVSTIILIGSLLTMLISATIYEKKGISKNSDVKVLERLDRIIGISKVTCILSVSVLLFLSTLN